MSFEKFKSDSYCVGGKQRSGTTKVYGDITAEGSKVLIGFCSICNRKKSMTASDNTIQAEGLHDFFKILDKKGLNVSKHIAKMYSKILAELLISQQLLLQQQQVEILKM